MAVHVRLEPANFVDRYEAQEQAFRAVEEWCEPFRPVCLSLSGLPGAGKTALAYRITNELRTRFPEFLHIGRADLKDARGEDGGLALDDVLGELLSSLDVDHRWLAPTLPARLRQFEDKTNGKKLIFVIDNVHAGAEIERILPRSGTAVVILISQRKLTELYDGTAVPLAVKPLDYAWAKQLLEAVTKDEQGELDERLEDEPEAAGELLRLCSGMPVAIRAVGQLMRQHRRRTLRLLLDDLTTDAYRRGIPVSDQVWDTVYDSLGPDAATLYRLVPGFPGRSFTVDAATALLGQGPILAKDALDELEVAELLVVEDKRMWLPDIVCAHANRLVVQEHDEQALRDGKQRIIRWFLRQAQRADQLAQGDRMKRGKVIPPIDDAPDVRLESDAGALRWLETERHALYDCVAMAYDLGLDAEAWALCEPLWTHHLDHPHYTKVAEAFRTGLAAAQRSGDVWAEVRMRCQLARPYWEQGRYDEAQRELDQASTAVETVDDRKLWASVREFHGMLRAAQGDWTGAEAEYVTALRVHEEIENDRGIMLLTYRQGEAVAALGEDERALPLLRRARSKAIDRLDERMIARTGVALAGVLRRIGDTDEARELYEAALTRARDSDSSFDQARNLRYLADLADETGDPETARHHRAEADRLRDLKGLN